MKSHDMMVAYLKLSPEERHEFDRFYARRVIFLRIYPNCVERPQSNCGWCGRFSRRKSKEEQDSPHGWRR